MASKTEIQILVDGAIVYNDDDFANRGDIDAYNELKMTLESNEEIRLVEKATGTILLNDNR